MTAAAKRSRRHGERGQMLPILAIFATLLFGVAALMADLSLQTGTRRNLQNTTDAAALAAAVDLTTSPNTQTQRYNGAVDALALLHDHLNFGTSGSFGPDAHTWATAVVGTQSDCPTSSGTHCNIDYTPPAPQSNLHIVLHAPPVDSAAGTVINGQGLYYEVELHQTDSTEFAQVGGLKKTTTGAHSIAYHSPAGTKFGYALYADSIVQSGNDGEIISGNVYAYRDVIPQSSGHAGICVDGSLVLGTPQAPDSTPNPDPAAGQPEQANVNPNNADTIQHVDRCVDGGGNPTVNAGHVGQTNNPNSSCSNLANGLVLPSQSYYDGPGGRADNGGTDVCVAVPAVSAPDFGPPTRNTTPVYDTPAYNCVQGTPPGGATTYPVGEYTCNVSNTPVLTVNAPLAQGDYEIVHNSKCTPPNCYDVTISGLTAPSTCATWDAAHGTHYAASYVTCLFGVTFVLEAGATIAFDHGASVASSPWSAPAGDDNPYDGVYPLYIDSSTVPSYDQINLRNGSTWSTTGSVYAPTASANIDNNSRMLVDGQAVVHSWNAQSGYHPNPDITYDPARVGSLPEVLRLVE